MWFPEADRRVDHAVTMQAFGPVNHPTDKPLGHLSDEAVLFIGRGLQNSQTSRPGHAPCQPVVHKPAAMPLMGDVDAISGNGSASDVQAMPNSGIHRGLHVASISGFGVHALETGEMRSEVTAIYETRRSDFYSCWRPFCRGCGHVLSDKLACRRTASPRVACRADSGRSSILEVHSQGIEFFRIRIPAFCCLCRRIDGRLNRLGPFCRSSFDQSGLVSRICLRPPEGGDEFGMGSVLIHSKLSIQSAIFHAFCTHNHCMGFG
jgi:hypothetical protein